MFVQDLVEGSKRKYEQLQSVGAVPAEEHVRVVWEPKELKEHHQEELKKIQEQHVAELQKLRDTKNKLLKEQKGMFILPLDSIDWIK